MEPEPLNQLLDSALRSGFITPDERSRLTQEFRLEKPSTMQDAANLLITNQVLTKDQAHRLVAALQEKSVLAGRYQIIAKLGEGGMGAVYKALDTKLDRLVAIKVMAAHQVEHADAIVRFHREAKALAKVAHPSIVQAYDADEDDGRHFLVMEFVDGINLARLLDQRGKVSPTRAADYIYQAALGIHHAHERGLVHRDLKPSNLLLTTEGQVKILDLGLARFVQDLLPDGQRTREGMGMGTPDYMAPEQFHNARQADARSDVYALGCTLYHLVSGRVPFPGSSLASKASAHEHEEPAPLEVVCPDAPAGLALAIQKMMAKHPADRFQTAREAAEALAPYVATSSPSVSGIVKTTSWQGSQLSMMATHPMPAKKRSVAPLVLVSSAFLACAVVALAFAWPWLFATPELPDPQPKPPEFAQSKDKDDKPEGKPNGTNDAKDTKEAKPKEEPKKPRVVTIANGITVAKDGTGEFDTISAALEKVQTGQTIRVLDDAIYKETVFITRPYQAGITLEAIQGASLRFPKGKVGLYIQNVRDVTVRGFHMTHDDELMYLAAAIGKCAGTRFDRLHLKIRQKSTGGVTIEGLDAGDKPAIVENCTVEGGMTALRVSGFAAYDTPNPSHRAVFRNNTVLGSMQGIFLSGTLKGVHVVGNRVAFTELTALQLENLLPGTEDILIANNTLYGCTYGFRLWERGDKKDLGKNVSLVNNLILGSTRSDALFLDSGGDAYEFKGPGNGAALLAAWKWEKNWRETAQPTGTEVYDKAWIPIAPGDTRKDKIAVMSIDSREPDFLKPAKESPLLKAGKGGDLPSWVGAVAPEGVEPWNWEWTWDALVHNRLTVSKDARTGGRFRSINKALDKARRGTTIRVLDKEVYEETLSLSGGSTPSGLVLESPQGATIACDQASGFAVILQGASNLTIRGFNFLSNAPQLTMILIKESAPGLLLDKLTFEPGSHKDYDAITFFPLEQRASEAPAIVQNCIMKKPQVGLSFQGIEIVLKPSYKPCKGVALRDNLILEPTHFGILMRGHLERVQVVGNRIAKCAKFAGMQIDDLAPASHDVQIANNTVCESTHAFRLWDGSVKGKRIEFCNNLFLGSSLPDMVFVDSGGDLLKVRGPGDGKLLAKTWRMSHNWREARHPTGGSLVEKSWVPPSETDVLRNRIEVLSRRMSDGDYVRPPADSELGKAGVGGDLPGYVGALPPVGVEAWDWNRTFEKWKTAK